MSVVDIEKEKQTLARIAQKWWDAWNRKDIDAEMEFMADDLIFQPANMPSILGKEAYRKFMEEFYKMIVSVWGESTRIEVSRSGDMAYDIGAYNVILESPEGTIEDEQKYLVFYKKIDGKWRCIAGSASSDKPPI